VSTWSYLFKHSLTTPTAVQCCQGTDQRVKAVDVPRGPHRLAAVHLLQPCLRGGPFGRLHDECHHCCGMFISQVIAPVPCANLFFPVCVSNRLGHARREAWSRQASAHQDAARQQICDRNVYRYDCPWCCACALLRILSASSSSVSVQAHHLLTDCTHISFSARTGFNYVAFYNSIIRKINGFAEDCHAVVMNFYSDRKHQLRPNEPQWFNPGSTQVHSTS
jgi:hypothetical protein